jgi:hypothetical protein
MRSTHTNVPRIGHMLARLYIWFDHPRSQNTAPRSLRVPGRSSTIGLPYVAGGSRAFEFGTEILCLVCFGERADARDVSMAARSARADDRVPPSEQRRKPSLQVAVGG